MPDPNAQGQNPYAQGQLQVQQGVMQVQQGVTNESEGIAADLKGAWAFLSPILVPSVLVIGASFIVPAVLGLIPFIGWLLAMITSIVLGLATPLLMGAACWMMLEHAIGRQVSPVAAIQKMMTRLVDVWLNFFVSGLISVVTLGILGPYTAPVYFIEKKTMVANNMHCYEYNKSQIARPILIWLATLLAPAFAVAILVGIGAFLLFIPYVGWVFLQVILIAAMVIRAVGLAMYFAAATRVWMELRTRAGADVAAEIAAGLDSWGAMAGGGGGGGAPYGGPMPQQPGQPGAYGPPQGGYDPPPGAYGAPPQGMPPQGMPPQGMPPQQGGYAPPQQGGYAPPQQGGYAPPQQGGYGPPPQGPGGYPQG
jgi:hypothetical protein